MRARPRRAQSRFPLAPRTPEAVEMVRPDRCPAVVYSDRAAQRVKDLCAVAGPGPVGTAGAEASSASSAADRVLSERPAPVRSPDMIGLPLGQRVISTPYQPRRSGQSPAI